MIAREYGDYVDDILESIGDIIEFIKGLDFESFSNDKKTINAVIRSLEIIGEAAKSIPQSIKEKYPDIPWKEMGGMRDKVIHEYFGVNMEIIWNTAKKDIPDLKPLIEKISKEHL